MKRALLLGLVLCACGRAPRTVGISVPYEVDTLDPHARNTLSHFSIVSHFYEPLVTSDADMKLRPCLARLWENPDPSTWVFHLQPHVTFHGGRPLTAEDVVYSIRRLTAAKPGEVLEMTGYVLYISEVAALDPLTVRIRTSRPLSILLNKLRFVSIVPKGSTAATLAGKADGTGPYVLEEWRKGEVVRMASNERYWGTKPALAKVEIRLDRAPEAAAQDLIAGRSQLIQCDSRKAEGLVRQAGRFELARRPSLFIKYLGFDVAREAVPYVSVRPNPFRDKRVRQAIHRAVDRERLVAGLSSDAVPATQIVPPTIFGFNPRVSAPLHDVARGRALLQQAGLAGGFEATVHVRKLFTEAAYLLRDQLRALDILLEVKVLGDAEFLEAADRGEPALVLSRFGAPTGDASDILDNALHSLDRARHMGLNNIGGYSNPRVDEGIEQSAATNGLQARRRALEDVVELIMEDLPWIPLYVDQNVYALDRSLSWQPRNDSFILASEIGLR